MRWGGGGGAGRVVEVWKAKLRSEGTRAGHRALFRACQGLRITEGRMSERTEKERQV